MVFCREFYSRRVYAFFVLSFLGKKCVRANFYTFRMSATTIIAITTIITTTTSSYTCLPLCLPVWLPDRRLRDTPLSRSETISHKYVTSNIIIVIIIIMALYFCWIQYLFWNVNGWCFTQCASYLLNNDHLPHCQHWSSLPSIDVVVFYIFQFSPKNNHLWYSTFMIEQFWLVYQIAGLVENISFAR